MFLVFALPLVLFGGVSVHGTEDWYYDNWCGDSDLVYLVDGKCQKKFPSNYNRDWMCPIVQAGEAPEGYSRDTDLDQVQVDTTSLQGVLSSQANVCLILMKRVLDATGKQVLYNKYFCADDRSKTQAFQPWSSTKIFAMANAAGHLRADEQTCPTDVFGLNSYTTGSSGDVALGDMSTIICSYDHTAGYSSNSLASYMHDLGWRERLHGLVTGDWLSSPARSGCESLGGNYGESTPSDLAFNLISGDGMRSCAVDKDPWSEVYPNSLTPLSAAEMTRRIAAHETLDSKLCFPGIDLSDIKDITYGAAVPVLFPGLQWGGMSADPSIFLQSSLNISDVEEKSQGQWRIFSKMGDGYINDNYTADVVSNTYACLPGIDVGGSNEGLELSISVRASVPDDVSLQKAEQSVLMAFQEVITAVLDGIIV